MHNLERQMDQDQKPRKTVAGFLATLIASSLMTVTVTVTAHAGAPFFEYSCHELWMERNGIYANKGYCFQTQKAIAVFGTACFAPYGQLNFAERKTVMTIRKWEVAKGC